jgi:hypothetical protein
MATITHNYKPNILRIAFVQKRDDLVEKLTPRRRMLTPAGMIAAGIAIPALMVFKLLPASLLLGFAGFVLVAVGGVLALVFCGEI